MEIKVIQESKSFEIKKIVHVNGDKITYKKVGVSGHKSYKRGGVTGDK